MSDMTKRKLLVVGERILYMPDFNMHLDEKCIGGVLRKNYFRDRYYTLREIAEKLNIDENLFYPATIYDPITNERINPYKFNAEQCRRVIHHYVETGKVDWMKGLDK